MRGIIPNSVINALKKIEMERRALVDPRGRQNNY